MPSTTFSTLSPTERQKLAPLFQRAAILSRPTKRSPPDEWAKENRVYPPSADRPGPRDVALTPYVVDYVRAFDDPRYDTVALACGSQMGKSEADLDVIGQVLDQRPAPIIYVAPSQDFLRDEIEPRVSALIEQSASLKSKASRGRKSTKFRKIVGGVSVRLLWAGSASQLSGTTARLALVDELDRMVDNVQGDGDPLTLVDARGFAHKDRKRGATSTPKRGNVDIEKDEESNLEFWKRMPPEDIESPIWRVWQRGTRHHFAWPCPECGEYFIPRFKQLRWPENATAAEAKRSAHIECPHCGGVIEEHHKADLNARGRYVAPGQKVNAKGVVTGDPPDTTTISFWVSGLCSPFVTIGERAAAYLEAKESGSQDKLQAVINTGFGELWAPGSGDVPEWSEVAELRRPYRTLEIPDGVKILTLAADVQKRRIVYTIRGWGHRASSWLVDFGELHGPTTESDVWSDLAELLHRPIGELVIRRAFIDSGFRPGKPEHVPVNKVYEFCRRFPRLVFPTKGRATQDKPLIVNKIEVTPRGNARRYGLDLILLDTDHFKSWVHERIRWEPDKPGAWLLPQDATDDYCKQIVAEARVKKPNGKPEWVARSRENHFLDCFDPDTELLTWQGWVRAGEAMLGMEFATVNLATDEIEYQRATHVISRHHRGDMVRIRGRGIDVMVTPNHRMVTYRKKKGPSITLARDLDIWHRIKRTSTWRGDDTQSVRIEALDKEPARDVDAALWMEFLGWYVSEGHRRKGSARNWQVLITQNPGANHDSIRALLDKLPWRYRVSDRRQFVLTSRQLYEALDDCYEPGEGAGRYRKRVPAIVKQSSPRLICRFVDAAVLGDGWVQGNSRTYATTSRRLADDMQELFLKIGRSANIKHLQPPPCTIRGKSYATVPQYHVAETRTRAVHLRRSDNTPIFETVPYDGMVHCVSVPNTTLIARRNGKPFVVGNCEAMQAAVGHMLNVHLIRDEDAIEPDEAAAGGRQPPRAGARGRARGNRQEAIGKRQEARGARVSKPAAQAERSEPTVKPKDAAAERRARIAALGARLRTR